MFRNELIDRRIGVEWDTFLFGSAVVVLFLYLEVLGAGIHIGANADFASHELLVMVSNVHL